MHPTAFRARALEPFDRIWKFFILDSSIKLLFSFWLFFHLSSFYVPPLPLNGEFLILFPPTLLYDFNVYHPFGATCRGIFPATPFPHAITSTPRRSPPPHFFIPQIEEELISTAVCGYFPKNPSISSSLPLFSSLFSLCDILIRNRQTSSTPLFSFPRLDEDSTYLGLRRPFRDLKYCFPFFSGLLYPPPLLYLALLCRFPFHAHVLRLFFPPNPRCSPSAGSTWFLADLLISFVSPLVGDKCRFQARLFLAI